MEERNLKTVPYLHQEVDRILLKQRNTLPRSSIEVGIEFLTSLYKSGIGYSAINTARLALSIIMLEINGKTFGEQALVKRFMKGIFELRPVFPKYSRIWDVNQVLNYLKSMGSSVSISLKMLTLRLTMLLCLLAGQRCQTVHALGIDYIDLSESKCIFVINHTLKNTKPGTHIKPLEYFCI